jgi:hypothetical protein
MLRCCIAFSPAACSVRLLASPLAGLISPSRSALALPAAASLLPGLITSRSARRSAHGITRQTAKTSGGRAIRTLSFHFISRMAELSRMLVNATVKEAEVVMVMKMLFERKYERLGPPKCLNIYGKTST